MPTPLLRGVCSFLKKTGNKLNIGMWGNCHGITVEKGSGLSWRQDNTTRVEILNKVNHHVRYRLASSDYLRMLSRYVQIIFVYGYTSIAKALLVQGRFVLV